MTKKIALITRPREDSQIIAGQLESMDFGTLIEPLITILKLDKTKEVRLLSAKDDVSHVIITSKNALHSIKEYNLDGVGFLAVGKETAYMLTQMGFKVIFTAPTVEDLLCFLLESEDFDYARLLYLSGDIVSKDIVENLETAGYKIKREIIYKSVAADNLSQDLIQKSKNINLALFYSVRTAYIFARLVHIHKIQDNFTDCVFFCLSKKVSKELSSIKCKNIMVAKNPDNQSLLELIEKFQFTN